MIGGIGMDLVELERLEKILSSSAGPRFTERVLTAAERERLKPLPPRRALEFIAGRFAAKEAVVKALGCGIGATAGFHDIEILPDPSGKPVCQLSGGCWQRLGRQEDNCRIHVAITHERAWAGATAVFEIERL